MQPLPTSRKEAFALDIKDSLRALRDNFEIPRGTIYLVGHSLGPPTKCAKAKVEVAAQAWRDGLVGSWNTAGWIDLAERTGDRIGALIGAPAGSVIVTDNVSVNLFKLASAALDLTPRGPLLIEEDEFPTDQYILDALGRQRHVEVRRVPPGEGIAALRDGGMLVKSAVNYRSSEVADIASYEAEARQRGAMIVWDLSHATGVLDLALRSHDVQLATGCTYKYLNGGPGAPAFVFVAPSLSRRLRSPLPGWMGHAAPFAFEAAYTPRDGTARFASGTPPILSLAALDGALDVTGKATIFAAQQKARRMGAMAIARAKAIGLEVLSPEDNDCRGGHVSLRIAEGYPVVQALAARGVLADFRAPDTVRLGFSPLFLRYEQVWDAMDALEDVLSTRSWDNDAFRTVSKVT